MIEKYYLDTAIWIDFYEDRTGFNNEPLGDYSWKLLSYCLDSNIKIVISDLNMSEFKSNDYTDEMIFGLFRSFDKLLERLRTTSNQRDEAEKIALERNVPRADVLHSIVARDNNLIMIARDKHFRKLKDITISKKPEDII